VLAAADPPLPEDNTLSPNLNFGTGSFTLSAWIRMSDTSRSIKTLIANHGTAD
jgi:hypothetical protein